MLTFFLLQFLLRCRGVGSDEKEIDHRMAELDIRKRIFCETFLCIFGLIWNHCMLPFHIILTRSNCYFSKSVQKLFNIFANADAEIDCDEFTIGLCGWCGFVATSITKKEHPYQSPVRRQKNKTFQIFKLKVLAIFMKIIFLLKTM